jgi:hypothetical protein
VAARVKGYVSDLSDIDRDARIIDRTRNRMATAQQIKNYEKKWINPKREGLMSDLPLAEQKAIRKRTKAMHRSAKITRAKMATKSFFDRYTLEVAVGAAVVVGGFFLVMHKKKTTGSIW